MFKIYFINFVQCRYAGMGSAYKCFCGGAVGWARKSSDSSCDAQCTDDTAQKCGGTNTAYLSVWLLGENTADSCQWWLGMSITILHYNIKLKI